MKNIVTPLSITLFFSSFLAFAQDHQSIIKSTEDSENHTTLLAAVRAVDLERTLDEDGPFTVFAPSDIAFKKLSADKVANLLLPENKQELHSVVTYHIVAGELTASKMLKAMCRGKGKATFTTVQGNEITATMRGVDIVLTDNFGNTAKITTADSNQCNGVIHEIDSVILPKKL
ncbi:MAG: fasciclin domain-containing protein [Bacteroidota bacterium]